MHYAIIRADRKVKATAMSEIREHAEYLSQTIGPRPAGTEEEQQAALYVAESLRQDAELPVEVEDFNCNTNHGMVRAICCALTFVFAVSTFFLPVMVLPTLLISLVAAVLFVLEALNKSPFGNMFKNGVSQNVVAKYQPSPSGNSSATRRRKIVLVANYDSGKVRRDVSPHVLSALPIVRWFELGAMAAVPLLLLVRFILTADGTLLVALNVLIGLAAVISLLPVVAFVAYRLAPYNDGANCNASGVSVLLEVAARIGRGRVEGADLDPATIHGEQAAIASGFVPEGAELVYEHAGTSDPVLAEDSPEARLLAAKAAVAALSGKPVSETINIDISQNLVHVEEPPVIVMSEEGMRERREETMEAFSTAIDRADDKSEGASNPHVPSSIAVGVEVAAAVASQPLVEVSQPDTRRSAPSWFEAAREKARKSTKKEKPAQRSRYADALDAAEQASHQREQEEMSSEHEARLQMMRESIMGVEVPSFDDELEQKPPMRNYQDQAGVDGYLASATSSDGYHLEKDGVEQPAPVVDERSLEAEDRADDAGRTIAFIPTPIDLDDLHALPTLTADAPDPAQAALDSLYAGGETADNVEKKPVHKKRAIDLPSLTGSLEPLSEEHKQRSPLAEDSDRNAARAKSLRASIPVIGNDADARPQHQHAVQASLRASLPSLSGVISASHSPQETEDAGAFDEPGVGSVSKAGTFASVGATGAFTPIGDELLDDVDPDEIYVDDADDSAYDNEMTETGAYAGPGYVDMPKSRASRLFGKFKFGKKKQQEEPTPQQWLNVDDDFEAREVGRARGGWESFRDDSYDGECLADATQVFSPLPDDAAYGGAYDEYDGYEEYDDDYGRSVPHSSRPWNGGAFSRTQLEDENAVSELDDAPAFDSAYDADSRAAADRVQVDDFADYSSEAVIPTEMDEVRPENVQRIYGFRHPDIDTEVWFVALGAELSGAAGMKAFLAEHADDLRGAIIVELEALGAGQLTLIEKEGTYRSVKSSSRMKRFTRKAASALGLSVPSAEMCWKDGSAACAARAGVQTMHIAGMQAGKPAYFGEGADVIDNLDEEAMLKNADFVMEVLKNV